MQREEPEIPSAGVGFKPWLWLLMPLFVLAAVALPLRYTTALSEPDLVRMLAALLYGHSTGLGVDAGHHYGLGFSFAWYWVLNSLTPDAWKESAVLTAHTMNLYGVVSGVFCSCACLIYLRQLFGTAVSVMASTLFLLAPVSLPLMFSGHPLVAAMGALLLGGWALNRSEQNSTTRRYLWLAGAWLLLIVALSLRAEVALGFPFLFFVRPLANKSSVVADWIRRALVLTSAFLTFLVLQHRFVAESGGAAGSLMTFLQAFVVPSRMARGVGVLVWSTGLATVLCVAVALLFRDRARALVFGALLAVPALLLWLPVPQPARHFQFAVLGVSLCLSMMVCQRLSSLRTVVLAALAIALGNQLLAEWLRPAIISRYTWSYPSHIERRATQQVPLGWFPSDQRANQMNAELQRSEAQRIAQSSPQQLLVLADSRHYLIAYLIAADQALRWTTGRSNGIVIDELVSDKRRIVLVEKYSAWPRDVTAESLANAQLQHMPIYVQPSTVSRYDVTPIPKERIYTGLIATDRLETR
jgi:hypothetical protein